MVGAGLNVFAVWGYIITKAKRGFIEINPKLLAFTLGGSEEEVQAALNFLQEPDPNSRSKSEGGRRLVKEGQFQYRIVNWQIYDEIKNEIERRDYNRVRQQQFRERQQASTSVNNGQHSETPASPPAPPVPPKPPKEAKTPTVDCITIFVELNDLTGSKFRPEGSALAMLMQRLAQSDVTADGVLQMVRRQVKLWKDDPKMSQFLRPTTLFNQTKFNEYYAAREQPIRELQTGKPNPRNFGIVGETTYGDGAKPRLQRELEEKKRLAGEVAADGGNSSAVDGGAERGL